MRRRFWAWLQEVCNKSMLTTDWMSHWHCIILKNLFLTPCLWDISFDLYIFLVFLYSFADSFPPLTHIWTSKILWHKWHQSMVPTLYSSWKTIVSSSDIHCDALCQVMIVIVRFQNPLNLPSLPYSKRDSKTWKGNWSTLGYIKATMKPLKEI